MHLLSALQCIFYVLKESNFIKILTLQSLWANGFVLSDPKHIRNTYPGQEDMLFLLKIAHFSRLERLQILRRIFFLYYPKPVLILDKDSKFVDNFQWFFLWLHIEHFFCLFIKSKKKKEVQNFTLVENTKTKM